MDKILKILKNIQNNLNGNLRNCILVLQNQNMRENLQFPKDCNWFDVFVWCRNWVSSKKTGGKGFPLLPPNIVPGYVIDYLAQVCSLERILMKLPMIILKKRLKEKLSISF